ncbi:unnamed protein product [Ectocarpus sp. 13 AM-2016]
MGARGGDEDAAVTAECDTTGENKSAASVARRKNVCARCGQDRAFG